MTFNPSADSYVEESSPSTTHATAGILKSDNSPVEWTYLRFDVSGVSGPIQSVKLRVYCVNGSTDGPALFLTGSGWTESGLNWSNKPAPQGAAVSNKGSVSAGTWVEYDVTSVVTGNGSYNFVLVPESTDGADFTSREVSSTKPQLEFAITSPVDGGAVDAPSPDAAVDARPPDAPVDARPPDAPPADSGSGIDAGTGTDGGTGTTVTFVGAGDIASCSNSNDEATAKLLDGITGSVFNLGDNAYEVGSPSEYQNCYGPTWGRHKSRTTPVVGNHEYEFDSTASGYAGYFGAAGGAIGKYYYSKDIGTWHIIVLNSELCTSSGCNSTMMSWLAADLAAHSGQVCTLAMFHRPRFSSGRVGSDSHMGPLWTALYNANADVILNGHSHVYERFRGQNPSGSRDDSRGIVEFIVGTGGRDHHSFNTTKSNSVVRNSSTFGVLKLTLRPGGYDFKFVPVAGKTFTDQGSGNCH